MFWTSVFAEKFVQTKNRRQFAFSWKWTVFITREENPYAASDWTYRFPHTWKKQDKLNLIGPELLANEMLLNWIPQGGVIICLNFNKFRDSAMTPEQRELSKTSTDKNGKTMKQ